MKNAVWFIAPLLGVGAMGVLPLVAIAEVRVDPTSHTLLPLEVIFYAAYGALVEAGVMSARRVLEQQRGTGPA